MLVSMRPGQTAFTRTSVRASWQAPVWVIEFTLEWIIGQSPASSRTNANTYAALLALSVKWVSSWVTGEDQVTHNAQDQLLTEIRQLREIMSSKRGARGERRS